MCPQDLLGHFVPSSIFQFALFPKRRALSTQRRGALGTSMRWQALFALRMPSRIAYFSRLVDALIRVFRRGVGQFSVVHRDERDGRAMPAFFCAS